MMKYSGSDWLKRNLYDWKNKTEPVISPLGIEVADLLGELFYGIYHLENKWIDKVDWSNNYFIMITIGHRSLSTFDFDTLTRLVFLAHHMCIRVDLDGAKSGYTRLLFHKRRRSGTISERHERLAEAVARFEEHVSIPEWNDPS